MQVCATGTPIVSVVALHLRWSSELEIYCFEYFLVFCLVISDLISLLFVYMECKSVSMFGSLLLTLCVKNKDF